MRIHEPSKREMILCLCILPYLLISLGLSILRDEYQGRRDRKFPKVSRRKRALSLPRKKNEIGAPRGRRTSPQTNSLFFKLPAELRINIYSLVIGKGKIYIILVETHKGHWQLRSYRCAPGPNSYSEYGGRIITSPKWDTPFVEKPTAWITLALELWVYCKAVGKCAS